MALTIATAMVLLVSAVVCWGVSKNPYNAGSITAFVWLIVVLTASLPNALNPPLLRETVWIVFGAGVCCSAFALGWSLISSVRPEKSIVIAPKSLSRIHVSLLVLLVIGAVLQVHNVYPLVQQLGGFRSLWGNSGAGADLRVLVLSERRAELADSTNWVSSVMTYVAAPGLLAPITGALVWKSRRFMLAVLPLVVVAVQAVVILERTSFMMALLMFLIALGLLRKVKVEFAGKPVTCEEKGTRKASRIIVVGIAIMGAVGALLLPLVARNAGTSRSTGWSSLAEYILSSIGGLNVRISEGTAFIPARDPITSEMGAYPGLGMYTFSGAFSVLRRLGLPISYRAPQSVDYSAITIFGQQFNTNTWTMLRELHMDFGSGGGFIAYAALFVLVGWAGHTAVSGRVGSLAMYAIVGGSLVWSFFGSGMLSDFRYIFAMICSFSIFKRVLINSDSEMVEALVTKNDSSRGCAVDGSVGSSIARNDI